MDIKNLEEAKAIRSKKSELESKIAEVAKTDPERAKKLRIALQVASIKADRIIGDGLGGDKDMIALAPKEEPIAAPVSAKPYVSAVRKKIVWSKPATTNGWLLKESDFDNMNKIIKESDNKPEEEFKVWTKIVSEFLTDKPGFGFEPELKLQWFKTVPDISYVPLTPYQTLMEKKKKNGGIIPGWKYLTPEEKALVDRMFM